MSTAAQHLADRLQQLAEHLTEWPNLAPVVVHSNDLQIHTGGSNGLALLRWSDSLGNRALKVQDINGLAYVYATGDLVTGQQATVWTTVPGLLESIPAIVEGYAGLPVQVLEGHVQQEADRLYAAMTETVSTVDGAR